MSFLRTPLFPPQALLALGLTMLCLQALAILVRGKKPGVKVKVDVKRGDETKTLEVTIGDKGVPE